MSISKSSNYVKKGLAKVRSKEWAEPLGRVLAVTGKVVDQLGNFVPGMGLVGGALSFGAAILNPDPSNKDLQKQLQETQSTLASLSENMEDVKQFLQEKEKKIETQLSNPASELRTDFVSIKKEMRHIFSDFQKCNEEIVKDVQDIKNIINQTFTLVVDVRFKAGLEEIDAAFEAFLQSNTTEDLQNYVFELRKNANQHLKPEKISEYLTVIRDNSEDGLDMCQAVMHYVILVLSKFLIMMVNFHIFKQDTESVVSDYNYFNNTFANLVKVFQDITGHKFVAGNIPAFSQIADYDKGTSRNLSQDMMVFLKTNGLLALQTQFEGAEVSLDDIKVMDHTDLKDIGITTFRQRKSVIEAARKLTYTTGGEQNPITVQDKQRKTPSEAARKMINSMETERAQKPKKARPEMEQLVSKLELTQIAGLGFGTQQPKSAGFGGFGAASTSAAEAFRGEKEAQERQKMERALQEEQALRMKAAQEKQKMERAQQEEQALRARAAQERQRRERDLKEEQALRETEAKEKLEREKEEKLRMLGIKPGDVLVSCDEGSASEWKGGSMGLFHKNHDGNTYTQAGGDQNLYQLPSGTWMIGFTMMGNGGAMINTTAPYSTLGLPPTHGWQYGAGDGKWPQDRQLTVLPATIDNIATCTRITISSTKCPHKEALGVFSRLAGEYSAGCPVFRNEAGWYLRVPTEATNWGVSDERDGEGGYIESGRVTMCPANHMAGTSAGFNQNNWEYGAGGSSWIEDITMTVKCDIHNN